MIETIDEMKNIMFFWPTGVDFDGACRGMLVGEDEEKDNVCNFGFQNGNEGKKRDPLWLFG